MADDFFVPEGLLAVMALFAAGAALGAVDALAAGALAGAEEVSADLLAFLLLEAEVEGAAMLPAVVG